MNAGCTTGGTVTSNGAVLNATAGGTTLYLCTRDTAGNTSTWNGVYNWENTVPPTPSKVTTTWSGDHYIKTSFTAGGTTVTDTGGSGMGTYTLWGNSSGLSSCNQSIASGLATPSYLVTGADLPSEGQTRYYCWTATDIAGNTSSTSATEYIRMDSIAPNNSSYNSKCKLQSINICTCKYDKWNIGRYQWLWSKLGRDYNI